MRFLVFLLLPIHLCCTAYGQEISQSICDEYPNLFETFSNTLETISNLENNEENNNTRFVNMNIIASIVWECSNNASEFNNIITQASNVYLTKPHMKRYILQLLDSLASRYEEVETYNEENVWFNRSTSNAIWVVGFQVVACTVASTSGVGAPFVPFVCLPLLKHIGITALFSIAPAVISEFNEDDLTIKLNPSVIKEVLLSIEAYNLTRSACELKEGLKITSITNEEEFNELTLVHENLRSAYAILRTERPRLFIPHVPQDPSSFSEIQEIDDFFQLQSVEDKVDQEIDDFFPPQLIEDEVYEEIRQSLNSNRTPLIPPRSETCENNKINLNITGCHLKESADILNNNFFNNDPIQFGFGELGNNRGLWFCETL